MSQVLLVWTNLPDLASARALARSLVERRLAACANLLPAVQSVYRWQGALEQAEEISVLFKTTEARYAELEAALRAAHPYQVPEILALPVAAGLPAYLDWVAAETAANVTT